MTSNEIIKHIEKKIEKLEIKGKNTYLVDYKKILMNYTVAYNELIHEIQIIEKFKKLGK